MNEKELFELEAMIQREAGLNPELKRLWNELEEMRVTPDSDIPEQEFLFEINGIPCFPLGELSAVCGRAKSGKTYFASLLMAACMKPEVMGIKRRSDQPLNVLWYDTEQSQATTQRILKDRIMGLTGDYPAEKFEIFNARCKPWSERQALLEAAIMKFKPQLVVLDGVRDLTDDINSNTRSQNVIERLMIAAQKHNCCIVCLIHQNKSLEDRSMRGSLGGELLNKAFEVFEVVNRDEVFSVEQVYSRMDRIKDKFIFALDEKGMPVAQDAIRSNYMSETAPQQETPRTARPQFNETYVKEVKKGGFVEFDDVKLFGDALRTGSRLNNTQLRKRVEQLSGIATTQLYYAVFYKARDRGIITGTLEGDGIMRYGLTAVAGASPYGAV